MTPMRWIRDKNPMENYESYGYNEHNACVVCVKCLHESDRDEIHKLLTEGAAEIAWLKKVLAEAELKEVNTEALCNELANTRDMHAKICSELSALRERVKPLVECLRRIDRDPDINLAYPGRALADWDATEKGTEHE